MPHADTAAVLRKVSALRALCLRLPHVPTPAESARLREFERLRSAPHEVTVADLDVIVTGWRALHRLDQPGEIRSMAATLPPSFLDLNRDLQSLLVAAAAVADTSTVSNSRR